MKNEENVGKGTREPKRLTCGYCGKKFSSLRIRERKGGYATGQRVKLLDGREGVIVGFSKGWKPFKVLLQFGDDAENTSSTDYTDWINTKQIAGIYEIIFKPLLKKKCQNRSHTRKERVMRCLTLDLLLE